jgi:hypothetical protein
MSVKLESSLTDLMTSLAVIFILLMVAMINNVGQSGKSDIENIRNELLDKYKIDCKPVVDDPLACTITFSDKEFMFNFGDDRILIQGEDSNKLKDKLLRIMETLTKPEWEKNINGVFIDGYTDKQGDDEINLELSQRRSLAVGQFLLNNVYANNPKYKKEDLDKYKKYLLEWLYLNGRGEQNPFKFDNYSYKYDFKPISLKQNRVFEIEDIRKALSRRVELTIRVKSFSQRTKQEIQSASNPSP